MIEAKRNLPTVKSNLMKQAITLLTILLLVSCDKVNFLPGGKAKLNPEIETRSQAWKQLHDVNDYDWFKENVLIMGMPKEKLIELLGEPTEITNEDGNYIWCYRKNGTNQEGTYARYFGVNPAGKLTWIGSADYDPHSSSENGR